jgi:hypothetical protein
MGVESWGPGTPRWAYVAALITGVAVVCLAVTLPLAITVNSELMWVTLALVTYSGVSGIAAVWIIHRHARRTKAAATDRPAQP